MDRLDGQPIVPAAVTAVSYTHLDVYKRQYRQTHAQPAREPQLLAVEVHLHVEAGVRYPRQLLERSAVLPGAMDPAGAAELYGYINAGMWTVMPQLEQLTRPSTRE